MPSKKPRKKKKKPSKKKLAQQQQAQEAQAAFHMHFSDPTMVETEGVYERINAKFAEPPKYGVIKGGVVHYISSSAIGDHDWNIKSNVDIISPFGEGFMVLDLRADRGIYIVEYNPSVANIYYNPDISCLMQWSQTAGWKVPQPTEGLIRTNVAFWRHMWETLLIDSDFLDKRYGVRKSLDMRDNQKTLMEEIEDEEITGSTTTREAWEKALLGKDFGKEPKDVK